MSIDANSWTQSVYRGNVTKFILGRYSPVWALVHRRSVCYILDITWGLQVRRLTQTHPASKGSHTIQSTCRMGSRLGEGVVMPWVVLRSPSDNFQKERKILAGFRWRPVTLITYRDNIMPTSQQRQYAVDPSGYVWYMSRRRHRGLSLSPNLLWVDVDMFYVQYKLYTYVRMYLQTIYHWETFIKLLWGEQWFMNLSVGY